MNQKRNWRVIKCLQVGEREVWNQSSQGPSCCPSCACWPSGTAQAPVSDFTAASMRELHKHYWNIHLVLGAEITKGAGVYPLLPTRYVPVTKPCPWVTSPPTGTIIQAGLPDWVWRQLWDGDRDVSAWDLSWNKAWAGGACSSGSAALLGMWW